jgi:SpoVK/Ycf46/Vps4 family AAA+-type ATPase
LILLKQVDKTVINRLKTWGIKDKKRGIDAKIIFYGVAGTGKTLTALALAKSLKKDVLSFDCSKILSMYIGESEKNVRNIFDKYNEIKEQTKTEPVLLLNEADQFLSSRSSGTGSSADKMHNQMQNIFLEQIERFDGILIATTNLLENLDKAFSRRFNYKIEFLKPNLEQRVALWKKLLPASLPLEVGFDIEKIAKKHKPKVLFLENVKNLISHDHGKTFRIIIEILEEKLGYKVFYKVLNSMTHANVPQNRERIFIVAFDPKQVKNYKKFKFPSEIKLTRTIQDILEQGKQDDKYYYPETHPYYPELAKTMTKKDTVYQWRRVYVRENKSNVCPTLTANMGAGGAGDSPLASPGLTPGHSPWRDGRGGGAAAHRPGATARPRPHPP